MITLFLTILLLIQITNQIKINKLFIHNVSSKLHIINIVNIVCIITTFIFLLIELIWGF